MLAIFNTGKTQLASFKQPNNCSAIDMRILSTLYYVGALKLSQLLKLQQKKLEPWFVLSFFLLQLIIIWIILPHSFLWNAVVISCSALSYYLGMLDKLGKKYVGLLALYFLHLLKHWLIIKMWPAQVSSIGTLCYLHLHPNWLKWFHFFIPIGCKIFLSSFLNVKHVCVFNFFPHTARLQNFLPAEYFFYLQLNVLSLELIRVSHGGRGHGGMLPHPMTFFENLPIKTDALHGAHPPFKNEACPIWKTPPPPHWKVKHPSMKWFLEKAQ